MRLIAGLESPTSGEVTIDERKIVGLDDRCSIVFQEPRLLPWRTILENVELGLLRRASVEWIFLGQHEVDAAPQRPDVNLVRKVHLF